MAKVKLIKILKLMGTDCSKWIGNITNQTFTTPFSSCYFKPDFLFYNILFIGFHRKKYVFTFWCVTFL